MFSSVRSGKRPGTIRRIADFKATCYARALEIFAARFDKLPKRERPFYYPTHRFQIVELKNLLGWSAEQVARLFRVCTHTIHNWEKHADPTAQTVGTTVRQAPPITRFADAVRNTVHLMAHFGFGGSVLDAFSRVPLVLQTYYAKPGASAMAKLLKSTARAFGKARYVITDQGGEFKGKIFRKTAARLGIIQRFGTKDRIFATARLERFWRSLKEMANLKILQPLTIEDLERRLEATLTCYLCLRPHQGLEGATPAEAFLAIEAASQRAVSPPRGRKGEEPQATPFTIGFLDPDSRAFPILNKTA